MTANCCDGVQIEEIKQAIQTEIMKMILSGQLQGGLMDCDGSRLGQARVATCGELTAVVEKGILSALTNLQTTSPIRGNGTTASPLTLDQNGLQECVKTAIEALKTLGLFVVTDKSLSGNGSATDPLRVADDYLNKALSAGKLTTSRLVPVAADAQAVSTRIIGGTDTTLGTPYGWIDMGNGLGIPCFPVTAGAPATSVIKDKPATEASEEVEAE